MVELNVNRGDTDQTLRSLASDLGMHSLLITLLGIYNGLTIIKPNKSDIIIKNTFQNTRC